MRFCVSSLAFVFVLFVTPLAVASSQSERDASRSASLNFTQRGAGQPTENYEQPVADSEAPIESAKPQSNCGSSTWLKPIVTALGGVAGAVAGGQIGDGAGRQVATVMSGTVAGVATNQTVNELCR